VLPHHALGHAGGAARVHEDQILRAALEVRSIRTAADQLLVGRRKCIPLAPVLDLDPLAHIRQTIAELGDVPREGCFVHYDGRVGVVEEVEQLVLAVAVVDVHGNEPGLHRREHRLEVLRPVVAVDGELVARLPAAREVAGERVGAPIELEPAALDAGVAVSHGQPIRNGVGDQLEDVGQIPLHGILLSPVRRTRRIVGPRASRRLGRTTASLASGALQL
jgi:hypothetical protein